MSMISRVGRVLFFGAIWLAVASVAVAADRSVVVNGELVEGDELAVLDALAGQWVPDGDYWIISDWVWGYAALPYVPQGQLPAVPFWRAVLECTGAPRPEDPATGEGESLTELEAALQGVYQMDLAPLLSFLESVEFGDAGPTDDQRMRLRLCALAAGVNDDMLSVVQGRNTSSDAATPYPYDYYAYTPDPDYPSAYTPDLGGGPSALTPYPETRVASVLAFGHTDARQQADYERYESALMGVLQRLLSAAELEIVMQKLDELGSTQRRVDFLARLIEKQTESKP